MPCVARIARICHIHSVYNSSFSACFFNRNNVFLSQQISQQYFSAGLSAQPNGPLLSYVRRPIRLTCHVAVVMLLQVL
jgi:hypothetical protein